MNTLATTDGTPAYACHGIWCADCPAATSPDGSLHLWPATRLERFEEVFICQCGTVTAVVWPSAEMVYGVERLLGMRPKPNQNWRPGETLIDLMVENAQHGIFDDVPTEAFPPGTSLLSVEEGRIVNDVLPALPGRTRLAVDA